MSPASSALLWWLGFQEPSLRALAFGSPSGDRKRDRGFTGESALWGLWEWALGMGSGLQGKGTGTLLFLASPGPHTAPEAQEFFLEVTWSRVETRDVGGLLCTVLTTHCQPDVSLEGIWGWR